MLFAPVLMKVNVLPLSERVALRPFRTLFNSVIVFLLIDYITEVVNSPCSESQAVNLRMLFINPNNLIENDVGNVDCAFSAETVVSIGDEDLIINQFSVAFVAPHNTPTTFAMVQRTTAIRMAMNVSACRSLTFSCV